MGKLLGRVDRQLQSRGRPAAGDDAVPGLPAFGFWARSPIFIHRWPRDVTSAVP